MPSTPQPSNDASFIESVTNKFNSLDNNFSQLFDEVQKLNSLMTQGSTVVPPPQPPVPTPAPAPTSVPVTVTAGKPPSFEKPDRFKGKSSEVETFVGAIQDAVELQGNSLTTERSKCIYMSTFLENSPKQWYCGIKKSHPLLLESFPLFIMAFIDHFGDSNLAYNATGKLEKLTQTGSAAAYAARFRELLVYVNWTEDSKINQFYKNLKPATKDLIATKKRSKRPTNFNKYVEFVIEYDNCVHERETERKEEKHAFPKTFPKPKTDSPTLQQIPGSSFLSALTHANGFGCSVKDPFPVHSVAMANRPTMPYTSYPAPPPAPDIKVIKGKKFAKLIQHSHESVSMLHFHNNTSKVFINSFSTKPPPPEPPPNPEPLPESSPQGPAHLAVT
ncbi:hypothetical protein D9757_011236 [Collybiopsis confluens]|uniref:Ty3 transposon capsid-like protein domain-containing protein n=1 Tax=Collybiopsis confluens TaxID=2823264 RepID=A0A8H5GN90_9AGAR|nr:hypothetical protein D9757_011236 [Collybiopsis confluens]